jgi:preprotein translocase YajC subunit
MSILTKLSCCDGFFQSLANITTGTIVVISLYFFVIREQNKQQSAMDSINSSITPGVEVEMESGQRGKIISIYENLAIIELAGSGQKIYANRKSITKINVDATS